MAPTVRPTVKWLDVWALLAILNADIIDFIVRTFLGSLMHIEIGDIRRLPVPVLTPEQSSYLSQLGRTAVEMAKAGDSDGVRDQESRINRYVRDIYGIDKEAQLWVAR